MSGSAQPSCDQEAKPHRKDGRGELQRRALIPQGCGAAMLVLDPLPLRYTGKGHLNCQPLLVMFSLASGQLLTSSL